MLVDTGDSDVTSRDDRLDRPQHELAEVHRVDAEIEERAAALREIEVAAGGLDVGYPPAEARLHEQRFAESTVSEDARELSVGGQEARPHRFHEEAVVFLGGPYHLVRL